MPQKVAIYLVDVSGSMGGQRISGAQKFVASMRKFYDRVRIYTYGDYGIERDYNTFAYMSAGGGTAIEQCLNDMFKSKIPQEKRNLVDFVLLTDAEDSINNLPQLQSNIASCKQQYTSSGGKLDPMATFFLTNGQHNDTSRKIVRAFGSASVFDNATIDKKLKETEQGIRQVMEAETAVTNAKDKIQSQINKAKVAAQKASQNEDAKKRRDELCAKSQKAAEARKKDIEQTQKDIDKIRDKQKNAANQSNDNKPEPNNNKAESNDNNNNETESNDNNDNNNKSEPNDNKPPPEPERIFETEEADDEEDGTMMKIFLSSKKMFKKLLEKKTWAGLGKLNKLFTLESVTDSLDNKKKSKKGLEFTLKFSEDFDSIVDAASEKKKRESIYDFKTKVRQSLCKLLNIGMSHVTTGEPYEGSINILIIIDKYGVEEFYKNYVIPELDTQFEPIRQQIEEKNPFDINDKTDKEIEEEKTKNELIQIENKLQNISNENNKNINELKQSVEAEEKQLATLASETVRKESDAAIKQFDHLESLLNNIRVASVQGKVQDMRNNLAKSKNEVLALSKNVANQKIEIDKTQINKQIENLKKNEAQIQMVKKEVKKGIEQCENVISDEIKMRNNKWKDEIYEEFSEEREKAMEEGNKEITKTDKEFKKNNEEIEEMVESTRSAVSSLSENQDENQDEKKDEKAEVDRIYVEAETTYKDGKNIIEDIENRNNTIVTEYIYGENKTNKFINKLKNGNWDYEFLNVELNGKQNDDEKYDEKKNDDEIYILKFDTDIDIIKSDNNTAEKFKHDIKITISKQLSIDENSIHINNVLEDGYDDEECVSVHFTIDNFSINNFSDEKMKLDVGRRSPTPNLSPSSSAVSFAPMIEMKYREMKSQENSQFAIIRKGIEETHPFDIDNKTEKEIEKEMNKNKLIEVENKIKNILNKNNKIINELKQLNEIEEKQSSVSEAVMNKFNHLETSLNNIQTKWVQPKVDDMKNNLKKTKDEIIIDFEKHKKLGINKTKINELILKLQKNESDIEIFKQKIEKGIDKCLKIIHNELEVRKNKWTKFIDQIFEKKKYGIEFEAMENIYHNKNARILSMIVLTKLNITITSATDSTLICYKTGVNKNDECKPFGKIQLPGNAYILKCSQDEKYLIAASENKSKDGLIIIWDITSFEDMYIKYYIESKRGKGKIRFRTPSAITMSNDNRYIFYCENGRKISIIDLKKKEPNKCGQIGSPALKNTITSISISDNLLVFGDERGAIGVFFLCLLQNKQNIKIKKFKSRRKMSKASSSRMNTDFDGNYPAIKLQTKKSYAQIVEGISISCDEKYLVLCGKRKVQCFCVILKDNYVDNLMKSFGDEQLKIMKELIKLQENSYLVATYGKQIRFNKKKPDIFCLCADGQKTVTFKVYNTNNKVTLMDTKTTKTKKKSSFAQIQFINESMCVIAYQTKSVDKKQQNYNPPKCYVWKFRNRK